MSDTADAELARADIVSRVLRQQEETLKFIREQHKLAAEAQKLAAEAAKRQRDRGLAPWVAVVAIITGISGVLGGIITALHIAGAV